MSPEHINGLRPIRQLSIIICLLCIFIMLYEHVHVGLLLSFLGTALTYAAIGVFDFFFFTVPFFKKILNAVSRLSEDAYDRRIHDVVLEELPQLLLWKSSSTLLEDISAFLEILYEDGTLQRYEAERQYNNAPPEMVWIYKFKADKKPPRAKLKDMLKELIPDIPNLGGKPAYG